ncbi:hypothetical protein C1Y41_04110 [Pantoea sp. ICBG 1758]|uniref:M91 family zinc metallopeptidase n=1 Tax=Pantoea sp. ICBG 1758 TaxID=2071682 RepID=UPI000CE4C458|nr:M91 family zinc metallopeptidase [Pantoea sp. ICBG 1758]PPC63835.1 hypothetical protein C1Y41_04110 [Pantoea sp. ICBG 1758]
MAVDMVAYHFRHINILAKDMFEYNKIDKAIDKIASKPHGLSLLKALKAANTHGQKVSIICTQFSETKVKAVLTPNQIERYQWANDPFDKSHQMLAERLARPIYPGIAGEGSSAFIFLNPNHTVSINDRGKALHSNDPNIMFLSLAHELIHALRMMRGFYKTPSEEGIESVMAARIGEEFRAIGIGKYAVNDISENSIRYEHGIPLRHSIDFEN